MAKWSESEIYKQTRGTNRFTRFVGWLNNLMNPDHSWVSDWNQFSKDTSPSEDIEKQITKSGLTGAEKEANAFSAQEAQKQRDWEQMMSDTAYQRQVSDMRAAGVNPALMMNGGSSGASTPSGSAATSASPGSAGVSMSELMQMYLLPLQKRAAEANIANTEAKTEREKEETKLASAKAENMSLVNAYYPTVQEAGLDETLSRIGVNLSSIDKNDAETAFTRVKKLIADKENEYADRYYKARAEYEEAHTEEAKASAAEKAAQALMTGYEYTYAKANGAKLSSSSILALVSALGSFLDLGNTDIQETVRGAVGTAWDDVKHPGQMWRKAAKQAKDIYHRWRDRAHSGSR